MELAPTLAFLKRGLVTSVGLCTAAAYAAIRAGVTNPTQTRFIDMEGEWLTGHEVPLEQPWRGLARLVWMASMAIAECLEDLPREDWTRIPLLLCVAERERPGRPSEVDSELFRELQRALGIQFAAQSLVIPQGRVAAAIALGHARSILARGDAPYVLIAGVDSLLTAATLRGYELQGRLLTGANSNGFLPGEGAGAVLMGTSSRDPALMCTGLGFGVETSHIFSEEPLRGDGLTRAIKEALTEAHCGLDELDFRITDISGEQYYFKEAALALGRILRVHKEEFELWHPAEIVGELGAAAGVMLMVVADAACRRGNAPGPAVLYHTASDQGQRAAAVLQFGVAT